MGCLLQRSLAGPELLDPFLNFPKLSLVDADH